MSSGRLPRSRRGAVLVAALPVLGCLPGCTVAVDGVPSAATPTAIPGSAQDLERLVVTAVPSGLPRLPDEELDPPAGEKRIEDVATYAEDPARERDVLEDYGYRFGWERFWGDGPTVLTGVFVDQFETRAGAGAYATDLARNDAEHYDAVLDEDPLDLPGSCDLLSVADPGPDSALTGPTVIAWCGSGVFSVGVTAVAPSVDVAEDEVRAVLTEQLDRLPPR
ncbi:DUF7373 family lipoprotein [Blastococcus haudaquaticus]|uniref:DUF7373 domain-containing protein n=1 Tax=Blastococcus haudaquaticus TaxID=1938745 RepID=A0A286GBY8_9ACTN|nr:hypothetical protein [Blastococcus haudaquaticus]SOD93043.1 hypothetical protein SAMN06272739_0136 [Blastococcus haudaquaticus]